MMSHPTQQRLKWHRLKPVAGVVRCLMGVFLVGSWVTAWLPIQLQAVSPSPDSAALTHLEGLRDHIPINEQETRCALHPDTGERKRETIHEEWKLLSKAMSRQQLEVLSTQQRSEFAAVLLRQIPTTAAQISAIYPIAVVGRDGGWLAAPLLGSFENTGIQLSAEQTRQQRELLQWISRETARQYQLMLTAQQQQLREQMLKRVQENELRQSNPEQLTQRLLQACAARDPATVLALLGGLEQQPSDSWLLAARLIHRCLPSENEIPWPWSEMAAAGCLRAWRHQELPRQGDQPPAVETLVGVVIADSSEEWPHCWKFNWQRQPSGMWSLSLPSVFWQLPEAEEQLPPVLKLSNGEESALYATLFQQSLEQLGETNLSQARSLANAVVRSLQESDFTPFWAAGAKPPSSDNEELPLLHQRWHELQGEHSACLFGEVGFRATAHHALLVLQRYDQSNSDRIELQQLWFERRDQRWFLCDEPPLNAAAELTEWHDSQESDWSKQWSSTVFAGATQIGGLADGPLPLDEVRRIFDQWHMSLRSRAISAPLRFCACFNDQMSLPKMMRNLAAERLNAKNQPVVLDVSAEGRWAGVCVQRRSEQNNQDFDPLYVFIRTENGPRLLSQVELKVSLQRRHERLNEQTLEELEKTLPVAAVAELRILLDRQLQALREREPQSIPPP